MTMLSFRVGEEEAQAATTWAERMGVDRSDLLREALHRYLVRLASEVDAERWTQQPATPDETALTAIADWGPADDWSDWADAAR